MPAGFVCTPTTLRALPFFSCFDDAAILAALPVLQVRTYTARAAIAPPATAVDSICLIITGKVTVLQHDDCGREAVLEELGEHDFFNEVGCFGGHSNGERFEAQTACTILFLPKRLVEGSLMQQSVAAQLLLQVLTRRLSRARGRIGTLALDTAYARVVDVLLQRGHEDNGEWFVDVGAEFIAALVGASREMVSRVVRDLIDRGLVRRVKRRIVVSDRTRLQKYATTDRAALRINKRHLRAVEVAMPTSASRLAA